MLAFLNTANAVNSIDAKINGPIFVCENRFFHFKADLASNSVVAPAALGCGFWQWRKGTVVISADVQLLSSFVRFSVEIR